MGRECPDCGSENIEEREKEKGFIFTKTYTYFICMDCGRTFG